jgi:hypothetical protein
MTAKQQKRLAGSGTIARHIKFNTVFNVNLVKRVQEIEKLAKQIRDRGKR